MTKDKLQVIVDVSPIQPLCYKEVAGCGAWEYRLQRCGSKAKSAMETA
jgi:hypothetical protein